MLDGVDEILTHDETEFYFFLGILFGRIDEAENKLSLKGKVRKRERERERERERGGGRFGI